jgi:chorismate synthase
MALRYTTAGESHGPAVIATVFGLPFGHTLDVDFINAQLRRRQGGYGRGGRQRVENDAVEVLSGLRRGVTIGSPLAMLIRNRDHRIDRAPDVPNVRPGHVDLAGVLKIGSHNARDVLERASARETAARVMAGAACQGLLRDFGVEVVAHVLSIGGIDADHPYREGHSAILADPVAARTRRDSSNLYTLAQGHDGRIRSAIDEARADGDTFGGSIEVVATGVPPGLGSHNESHLRLDGRLAAALMSIQAMKAVELGLGMEAARALGSEVHDPVLPQAGAGGPFARASNNAGGLEGGVSNGEAIVCRVHMKPISTLMSPLPTVDVRTGKATEASTERSDVCAVPAAAIVAESAVAFVLAQALLEKVGGDAMDECTRNFEGFLEALRDYRQDEA